MRRSVGLAALWTASAAAAVGLGFLAVSLVGATASPGATPVGAATTPSTSSGANATPTAPVTSASGEYATVAGTVFADCSSGQPVLAGAPAAGWWADDSHEAGEFEFRNGTEELEVHVTCDGGVPQFSVEGPRADHSDGGGHGSDDGPEDDSSGRGGGHGSDD
jgi:hypothetical protein